MTVSRRMLSFAEAGRRFNYRVAGIAIRDGNVLVCREDDDTYVLLPGGRVEFGERSDLALDREVEEETGFSAEVGPLLFTSENFFERDGEQFHEIGLYYSLTPSPDFPFSSGGVCHATQDEGHELTFSWIRLAPEPLDEINLLPAWLRHRLGDLPSMTEHLVMDER